MEVNPYHAPLPEPIAKRIVECRFCIALGSRIAFRCYRLQVLTWLGRRLRLSVHLSREVVWIQN